MAKKHHGIKIKNFTRDEEDEILDSLEEANNASDNEDINKAKEEMINEDIPNIKASEGSEMQKGSGALKAIRTFGDVANGALSEASRDQYEDEDEEGKAGERYQSDFSNLGDNTSNLINDMIKKMRRNDLSKSEKEREAERVLQDQNVAQMSKPTNESPFEKIEKTPSADSETIKANAPNPEEAAKKKEMLDKAFDKPKKKASILEKAGEEKKKAKASIAAKKEAVKDKGAVKSLVEKTTGEEAGSVMGTILEFVFWIIIIVLVFTLLTAVIFYFSNNYTRETEQSVDTRRLDTRAVRAVYAMKEEKDLEDLYSEYFATSTGEQRTRFEINYKRLIPTQDVIKIRAAENPEEAYILQDSTNWFLLYLERLSYAWGGYLDWKPDFITDGVIFANVSDRNPAGDNVERWRDIASVVGSKYGIDENILLSIIDIESGGNPHAENEGHKGLGQIGSDFVNLLSDDEKFSSYTPEMRMPVDTGSCDCNDRNHRDNAEMQLTYIARRLSNDCARFLKQIKGKEIGNTTSAEKELAICYAVTSYNQGEARIEDLYGVYGDDLYKDKGLTYKTKFLDHVDERLPKGFNMIGPEQAGYLKLFYKFYESYSGHDLMSSYLDSSKWYKESEVKLQDKKDVGNYLGNVDKEVKLLNDSVETGVVNEIKEDNFIQMTSAINDQYNRWMTKLDNSYIAYYPDKFLRDGYGRLIPDIYAKDIYGVDTNTVIKHKSYIHNIVSDVTTYETEKTYRGSIEESYNALERDLQNESNSLTKVTYTKEATEKLSDIEADLAINRYEMSFEALRTVDTDNEMLNNDNAVDMFETSLKYSVPIYEYVTTNLNNGYKSFFDYEIYNQRNYNSDFTLKINHSKFREVLNALNNINLSMKSFVKYGYTYEGAQSVLNRTEMAFDYLYLNNDKAYNPSNHSVEIPGDLETYFYSVNGNVYSKLIEKVYATEKYSTDDYDNEYEEVRWEEVTSDGNVRYNYDGLDTKVVRDYYLPNLVPSKYTSLKYEAQFDYVGQETGDREIKNKSPETKIYKGTVYKKIFDPFGNDTGERTFDRVIYRKEIKRENCYTKEKERYETISSRGM